MQAIASHFNFRGNCSKLLHYQRRVLWLRSTAVIWWPGRLSKRKGSPRSFPWPAAISTGSTTAFRNTARSPSARGVLSVVGIGDEVKLDLTPLWLKLQTIKGVYSYGWHSIDGERRHTYDLVLDLVREGKVRKIRQG